MCMTVIIAILVFLVIQTFGASAECNSSSWISKDSTVSREEQHDDIRPCVGKENGVYTVDDSNCTSYYRCYNGSSFFYHCDETFAYDVNTASCMPASAVACGTLPTAFTSRCIDKPDGVYQDYKSHCHNYYWCEGNRKTEFTCGESLIFDMRTSSCVEPHSVNCQPPTCSGKSQGFYAIADSIARMYYHCKNNASSATVHVCPPGRTFDPTVSACRSFPVLPSSLPDCSGKTDGWFPDISNNCHSYYYCSLQLLVSILSCPHGHAFDSISNQCQDEALIQCRRAFEIRGSLIGCDGKADGYFPDYLSKCEDYYYCLGGKRTLNVSCAHGQSFNSMSQKCEDSANVICSPAILEQFQGFCMSKIDGFYPNYVTGCKSYVYCHQGMVASEVTCPKGRLYDISTKRCTNKNQTICLSNPNETCVGRFDGYYADLSSGCRKYFYCVNGVKLTEKSCPYKKQFDLEKQLCIEEDTKLCVASGRSPECSGKLDGYYPNLRSGCKKFFYCRSERKVSEVSCPPQQIFDQEGQACTDWHNVACGEEDGLNSCSTDGQYGDTNNGCQSYYTCKKRQKVATHYCAAGRVFDAATGLCVLDTHAICRQSDYSANHNCSCKQDGFYPLSSKQATKFYQCENGHSVSFLECPPGGTFEAETSRCEISNGECLEAGFCCLGLPDAYYVTPTAPDSIHVCLGNRSWISACPANLEFNWSLGACDNSGASILQAESQCFGQNDGIYSDRSADCRSFYVCIGNRIEAHGICPWGEIFDESRGICFLEERVMCKNISKDIPSFFFTADTCSNKPNGYFADVSNNCSSFFQCENGSIQTILHCPDKSIFLEETRTCVNESTAICITKEHQTDGINVKLLVETKTNFPFTLNSDIPTSDYDSQVSLGVNQLTTKPPPLTTSFITQADFQHSSSALTQYSSELPTVQALTSTNVFLLGDIACKDKPNGVYPDYASKCQQYYICFRQVKMAFSCSGSQLFNYQTKMCDDPINVVCHEDKVVELHPNGSAEDTSNDVRSKEYATDDSNLANQDSRERSMNGQFACYPFETGFFPDYSSECRDFYVCFRGIRKQYSCPADLLFNPATKNCDSPENVKCSPQPEKSAVKAGLNLQLDRKFAPQLPVAPECPLKSKEVFPDYESGCRKYTVCSKGNKMVASCPLGTIFNIRIGRCDLESNVVCSPSVTQNNETEYFHHEKNDTFNKDMPAKLDKYVAPTPLPENKSHDGSSETTPPFDCSSRADGFYADYSRHCHVFYRCLRGGKLSYYCKVGQLFNPILQVCDFEENVSCVENNNQ